MFVSILEQSQMRKWTYQGGLAGEPGGCAGRAAADLLDGLRAEGGGGLAEPEAAVGSI